MGNTAKKPKDKSRKDLVEEEDKKEPDLKESKLNSAQGDAIIEALDAIEYKINIDTKLSNFFDQISKISSAYKTLKWDELGWSLAVKYIKQDIHQNEIELRWLKHLPDFGDQDYIDIKIDESKILNLIKGIQNNIIRSQAVCQFLSLDSIDINSAQLNKIVELYDKIKNLVIEFKAKINGLKEMSGYNALNFISAYYEKLKILIQKLHSEGGMLLMYKYSDSIRQHFEDYQSVKNNYFEESKILGKGEEGTPIFTPEIISLDVVSLVATPK